jgi:hypothetical protein
MLAEIGSRPRIPRVWTDVVGTHVSLGSPLSRLKGSEAISANSVQPSELMHALTCNIGYWGEFGSVRLLGSEKWDRGGSPDHAAN